MIKKQRAGNMWEKAQKKHRIADSEKGGCKIEEQDMSNQ